MINKQYKYGFWAVIALCLVLMGVGAVYDWQITDTLYKPDSFFGIFFEAFAYFPIYAFIPVLGACMMITSRDNGSSFAIGAVLLIFSCCIFFYSAALHLEKRAFITKTNPYLRGMAGGLLAAGIFLLIRKASRKTVKKLQSLCAFAAMFLITHGIVFTLAKKLFGRDRYEDIIADGANSFARWFKPVFFSSGSSFPSGHTGAAMGMLILLLLPFLFEFFADKKNILFIAAYIYRGLMAFSRMVMGRHFLSDTAMAIILMTVIFMILTPLFEKLYKSQFIRRK